MIQNKLIKQKSKQRPQGGATRLQNVNTITSQGRSLIRSHCPSSAFDFGSGKRHVRRSLDSTAHVSRQHRRSRAAKQGTKMLKKGRQRRLRRGRILTQKTPKLARSRAARLLEVPKPGTLPTCTHRTVPAGSSHNQSRISLISMQTIT